MADLLFVALLAVLSAIVFGWAFRALPQERWQILAAVPLAREEQGSGWRGLNLTWYGVMYATACTAGAALFFVLVAAIGAPATASLPFAAVVLGVCLPAARLVARVVERRRYNFTVAGAFFVGMLIAPPAVWLVNAFRPGEGRLPLISTMAALAAAYALGEGFGRLACISFGCCYGKPVDASGPLLRRLFSGWAFVFSGPIKKACYEGGLQGVRLVPVQAVTAALFTAVALSHVYLFLKGWRATALVATVAATQTWRFLSEFLRADFRGGGRLSAYQGLALAAVVYCASATLLVGAEPVPAADVLRGLQSLWNPATILILQGLWAAVFVYSGFSRVTGSRLEFHVRSDRV